MFWRRASYVSLAAGLGLLVGAAYLSIRPTALEPAFEVEEAAQVFDLLPADKAADVEFVVQNRTARPLRVIGTQVGSCTYNCDFRVKSAFPLDVPSRGSATVVFTLIPFARADTFSHTVPLYLDDGALREVTLSVEGKVVQPLADH